MAPTLLPGDWALTRPAATSDDGRRRGRRASGPPRLRDGEAHHRRSGDRVPASARWAPTSGGSRAISRPPPRTAARSAPCIRTRSMSKVVLVYWPHGAPRSGVGLADRGRTTYAQVVRLSRRTAVGTHRVARRCSVSACDRTADRASTASHPSPSAEPTEGATRGGEGDRSGESDREGETEGQDADRIDRPGSPTYGSGPSASRRPAGAARQLFGRANDWEPATAADPSAPYVYVLTTRYSGKGPLPCASCDIPAMAFRASERRRSDVRSRPVSPRRTSRAGSSTRSSSTDGAGDVLAQLDGRQVADRVLEVDRSRADVDSARVVSHGAGWGDHPWLGVSPNGLHVYIGFNHAASWVAQSHDGGATWLPAQQVSTEDRYYFANGTAVTDDGERGDRDRELRVAILDGRACARRSRSRSSGPTDGARRSGLRRRRHRGAASWLRERRLPVQSLRRPRRCWRMSGGRPWSLAYDGAVRAAGDQYLWVRALDRTSATTWTDRSARLSAKTPGVVAMNAGITAGADGEVRDGVAGQPQRPVPVEHVRPRARTTAGASWDPRGRRLGRDGRLAATCIPRGCDADYGDYCRIGYHVDRRSVRQCGAPASATQGRGTWFQRGDRPPAGRRRGLKVT